MTCWACHNFTALHCRIHMRGWPCIGPVCMHYRRTESGTDEDEAITERLIDCQGMPSEPGCEK